jgi:amino-acid N-acetyltransferase
MTVRVTPTFQVASSADLQAICAILTASQLPIDDVERHLEHFVLAKWDQTTIGTVALEYADSAALLRSLCVIQQHRGQAVGARLLSAIEGVAYSRGVRELYLLTTSASAFFAQHGFSMTLRAAAPPGIRATLQFLSLCPATASCMRKSLSPKAAEATGSN